MYRSSSCIGVAFGRRNDVKRDALMRAASEALHFEIAVPGVERIAQRRRWLRRTLEGQHSLGPSIAGEPVGFLARLLCPFRRRLN
jgi:hypothetical protein